MQSGLKGYALSYNIMEAFVYVLILLNLACWVSHARSKAAYLCERVAINLRGKKGGITYVSRCDMEKLKGLRLYDRNGYANVGGGCKLHIYLMGERPEDVPADWIIDHKNWNKLDNTRENLRWVSQRFNNWNVPVRSGASSLFKGVSKRGNMWQATALKMNLGYFSEEREAGRMSAKAYIQEFGELAATSAVLLGVGPGQFTFEEIQEIKADILHNPIVPKETGRNLPKGLHQKGDKITAKYKGEHIGTFSSVDEAEAAYNERVRDIDDREWNVHLQLQITRDADGHAAIQLSNCDKMSKVDDELWHMLTFRHLWCLNGEYVAGNWNGKSTHLHAVVYKHYNLKYVPSRKASVDHVVPEKKLDNRKINLQVATQSQQDRNKRKRGGCTSRYIGVHYNKKDTVWVGLVHHEGKTHRCSAKTENEAARLVNEIRIRLFGDRAILINIIED